MKRLAVRVVSDEYLDLYILALAALTFTILGVVGVADIKVLASVILQGSGVFPTCPVVSGMWLRG